MARNGRLRVDIDSGIKPHFKAKCTIEGTNMSKQAEDLIRSWIESDRQILTNQARVTTGRNLSQTELQIEIDEEIKAQFASKCAVETVTMGNMLEALIINWIDS